MAKNSFQNFKFGFKQQREMIESGWHIELPLSHYETPIELWWRLCGRYEKVRVSYQESSVLGYYDVFAMVK